MKTFFTFLLVLLASGLKAKDTGTVFVKTLLESHPELFSQILNHPIHNDKLVMKPYDFTQKNIYTYYSRPANGIETPVVSGGISERQQFDLTKDDYRFIYRYMSMYPTETRKPAYYPPEYYPAFCKYLFYGQDSLAAINPDVRIFNKIGDSYGYDVDNAYIVDFKSKVEFMLTAVVQSNDDGIYNYNKYEYKTVCLPFMRNLGQLLYQYELKRHRAYLPDLSKFKFTYE